jgi:regulatory protein
MSYPRRRPRAGGRKPPSPEPEPAEYSAAEAAEDDLAPRLFTDDPGAAQEDDGDRRTSGRRAARSQTPEPARDPARQAREVCLRLLALSPKTRAQLAAALRKRDIPDEVADEVLSRFEDVGLIDDAAFARAWVESRHYSRGLAGRALSAELKQRGVASDEIRAALEEQLSPDAEATAARRLVDKKLGSTRGQPPEQRTRRLAGMLARKGYPPGLAFRVIREALEAEGVQVAPEDESFFDSAGLDTE